MLSKRSHATVSGAVVRTAHFLVLAAALPVLAQESGAPCNLGTFKGVYSLVVTGQIINEPSVPIPQPAVVSRVGRAVADGNGNITFEQRGSYFGIPSAENAVGTYTVTSDCFITFIINAPPPVSFPVIFEGTTMASGDSLTIMQIDPDGTTVKVNSKRVQNVCAWEDLKGTYMLDLKGAIPPTATLPPDFGSLVIGNDAIAGDYQELGVLTFRPPTGTDLAAGNPGTITGKTTTSYHGALDTQSWSGTYTIDKECRVNASFTKHAGAAGNLDFTWWGVLADQGRDLRIVQEPLTLGAVDGDAILSSR
jgi:hypothetical protein